MLFNLRCPECKHIVSMKWVLFSNNQTNHRCVKCNTTLKFTKIRIILAGTIGAITLIYFMKFNLFGNFTIKVILWVFLVALIFFFTPKQIEKVES